VLYLLKAGDRNRVNTPALTHIYIVFLDKKIMKMSSENGTTLEVINLGKGK